MGVNFDGVFTPGPSVLMSPWFPYRVSSPVDPGICLFTPHRSRSIKVTNLFSFGLRSPGLPCSRQSK